MALMEAAHVAVHAQYDEEAEDFLQIDEIQKLGIAAGDIKKLKDAGMCMLSVCLCAAVMVLPLLFSTCQPVMVLPLLLQFLTSVKGLSEAKADKIVEAARKMDASSGWQTGLTVMHQREKEIRKISTGCAALDAILGGGVETSSLTELHGECRTGKTQLCMMLAVMAQMPVDSGGAAGKVAYIDTEGTFRPDRMRQIAQAVGLEADSVLENIAFARAHNHEHQSELLVTVAALMAEDVYKLLIMDGLMSHYRVDFVGRGELSERQQKLNVMLSRMKKIAEEFNVAVVITQPAEAEASFALSANGVIAHADWDRELGGGAAGQQLSPGAYPS
ncbi:hypothetical protein FOA52_002357 [Chlamydomonas sp. UWO 241]|nr:hypothetical protein FOA52_002357 [Chlamydomonas sp. UWO 241]